jgi:hypothetical protein
LAVGKQITSFPFSKYSENKKKNIPLNANIPKEIIEMFQCLAAQNYQSSERIQNN